MNQSKIRETVIAKIDQFFNMNFPDFVHAQSEAHNRQGWTKLTFPSGFQCTTNGERLEAELIYQEVFVTRDYFHGSIRLADEDTVVDIGANIGMFSMYVLENFANVHIYAVEPMIETYQVLQENLARYDNGITHAINMAVGARKNSAAEIVYFPSMTGNSTCHPETKVQHRKFFSQLFSEEELEFMYTQERVSVPSTTLSDLISKNNIDTIDLLKVDTEGSEIDVLQGIEASDWLRIKQITMEIHDESKNLPIVTKMLGEHGMLPTTNEASREPMGTVVISAVRE